MKDHCVLVTGGAGYVGSHVVHALLDAGQRVVTVDNLASGHRESVPGAAKFIQADVGNRDRMTELLREERCDVIMHLAGSAGMATAMPALECYRHNTCASRSLMEAAADQGIDNFIFASSAAVYGNPDRLPAREEAAAVPCSPYGRSKLMAEEMLRDISEASGLRFVILRYFNVAGTDSRKYVRPAMPEAPHLIKAACEAACGTREGLTVFGDDYDTPDGTGVRDYVHVGDLAEAHVRAMEYLVGGGGSEVLNCGRGHGHSVTQVLDAVRRVSGRNFPVEVGRRRPGDIGEIYAATERARDLLGWTATRNLDEIIASAYAWECQAMPGRIVGSPADEYAAGFAPAAISAGGAS